MSELSSEALEALTSACPIQVDPTERLAYARDLWPLGHIGLAEESLGPRPWAVASPRSEDEVRALMSAAHRLRIPVIPYGEGSGVCGGTVAHRGGIALNLKGLDRILEVCEASLTVSLEPGINGQVLEDALERRGLTLGHSPSSILCSTVGGWLAARSAGQLSTLYGKIEDMVVSLRVVLADGTLVETVAAPRAATGPDFNELFLGSEGTLGVITAARLRVHRSPALRRFLSFEAPGLEAGLSLIREALQQGLRPAAVRLYDPLDTLLVGAGHDHAPLTEDPPLRPDGWLARVGAAGLEARLRERLPGLASRMGKGAALDHPKLANELADRIAGRCLLIFACEGHRGLTELTARELERLADGLGLANTGPEPAERWYRNRHAVSFKQSEVFRMGAFSDTFEVATTWERLPGLYAAVRAALAPHVLVLAHFSHAYHEGCSIYFTMAARCGSPEAARERYQTAWREGLRAAVEAGAAISHHHGIGLLKADALKRSLGPLHGVFQRLKDALDPENILNPGKMGLR